MRFKAPFFITPHAVKRFQERIDNIPASTIIKLLQLRLQNPGAPVDWQIENGMLIPIFQGQWRDKYYYFPVVPGDGEWPAVPTVYGKESIIHDKWAAGKIGFNSIFRKEARA